MSDFLELPRLEQFMGAMTGPSRINFESFAAKFDFSRFGTLCDVGGAFFHPRRPGDGDFLFLDSTLTVRTGSDCLHIYPRLLPRVRRNVLVHSHDVFLPFALPQACQAGEFSPASEAIEENLVALRRLNPFALVGQVAV